MRSSYAGYFLNAKKLLESSSGGAATAISEQVIKRGGVCFGVKYDTYNKPVWGIARTQNELVGFKGSKYAESVRGKFHTLVVEELTDEKPVLVVGLPCDIAAVRMYIGRINQNYDNLFLCELICSRVTSQKVLLDFISSKEASEGKKVITVSLRYKHNGMKIPFFVRYIFEDGTETYEPLEKTDFERGFYYIVRTCCTHCSFKGDNSVADLRLGDYLSLNESHPYYNPGGVSLIIECSKQGRKLLEYIDNSLFQLHQTDLRGSLQYNKMTQVSFEKHSLSNNFINEFLENGLNSACRKLLYSQVERLYELLDEKGIDVSMDMIALWGIGNAANILYDKFEMSDWNIKYVFDSNKIKEGTFFKGIRITNLSNIPNYAKNIDAVIITISTVPYEILSQQLYDIGYLGKSIYLGGGGYII